MDDNYLKSIFSVYLEHIHGKSFQQIAKQKKISLSKVKNMHQKSCEYLRRYPDACKRVLEGNKNNIKNLREDKNQTEGGEREILAPASEAEMSTGGM